MADYIREKQRKYDELQSLDDTTRLSDDLYAYFLLEGSRLKDEQRKMVTMIADNQFETKSFITTLNTNFHDVHLQERRQPPPRPEPGKGKDKGKKGKGRGKWNGKGKDKGKSESYWVDDAEWYEEEEYYDDETFEAEDDEETYGVEDEEDVPSDAGASQDEDVAEAFAAYDQARAKLKAKQRSRGFFKAEGTMSFEERKEVIASAKKTSKCGACGRIGHWAGDKECPMADKDKSKEKPKPRKGAGHVGSKRGHAAYFVLDDVDYETEDASNYVLAEADPIITDMSSESLPSTSKWWTCSPNMCKQALVMPQVCHTRKCKRTPS